MQNVNILFTAEADEKKLEPLLSICNVTFDGWRMTGSVLSEDSLIDKLQNKQIFATSYEVVSRKVIESCPDLQLIVCTRANPVNIDINAAKEHGIVVAYTPGRNSDVTAEFAVAMLLNVARNITAASQAISSNRATVKDMPSEKKTDVTWGKVENCHPYTEFKGQQIKNKNIGILGFGSIGSRVAHIMSGFGANILVFDPFYSRVDIDCAGMKKVSFDELLRESDFITCHTKITKMTTGLFDLSVFKKMKNTAYLINNSRGAIIVEEDLVTALREGHIAGAALDVFDYEPLYETHPFLTGELKNILLTPHISGASDDAISNGTVMLIDEIFSFLKNEPLLHVK